MKRRNPLLAGLFNVLVPGSHYLYVRNDWRKFILFLIAGVAAIGASILVGNTIQNMKVYTLSQGLCTGILLSIVLGVLFYNGLTDASSHNSGTDSAAHYKTMREGSRVARLEVLNKQRAEGLISDEEYMESKKEIEAGRK
ncbi:MAG: SHOCT domain-containing protein [Chloroflexi bacterium]|nr:SHOCT domain-containing protein [Chloroflexota bacterium]